MSRSSFISSLFSIALASNALGGPTGIDWSSTFGATNYLSDGTTTFEQAFTNDPANFSFTFQLGDFGGVDPNTIPLTQWAAAWDINAFSTAYNTTDQNFSAASFLIDNNDFDDTERAYIWGFNSKAIDENTEWILIGDPTWIWPTVTEPAPPNIPWTVPSAPQSAEILGEINGPDFNMMTVHVMTAIPEPSVSMLLPLTLMLFLGRRNRCL